MTLDILRLTVTKDLLRRMQKEERSLFLALGHASNQVNALWKLVIILTNGDTEEPVKQRLEGAQTQVFVRLTIGAMWEAWRLVEDRFLKRPLGREYLPLLDAPAKEALDRLKKRFGKGSGLATIRNNYAFHHPDVDDIDAAFEKAASEADSEEADWAVYFNKGLLNTFFFVSDYVLVHGMSEALSEPNVNKAHRQLLAEMAPVASDLSEFAFGYAAAIFQRHVGAELTMKVVAKVDDAPDIDGMGKAR
ncbi:hypothetical protein [Bradyrhizobium australiense]|uniref:HEPN AbiU2-like domain-containing protein n=1 Tax=Bradyrhizobium australiense TaxID=2721161 RepID=A0A7Y4LU87_9BRAD|nr:hypothetical protein [Bradyrhizobium australiense]NOJ39062.1 hypothetical protein [Bradyrhizobium australiense]